MKSVNDSLDMFREKLFSSENKDLFNILKNWKNIVENAFEYSKVYNIEKGVLKIQCSNSATAEYLKLRKNEILKKLKLYTKTIDINNIDVFIKPIYDIN